MARPANKRMGTVRNDTLLGSRDDDLLNGLNGNDLLIGLRGNDTLLGGPGNDLLIGDNSGSIVTRIVEDSDGGNVTGGPTSNGFDDYLFGDGGRDKLFGGRGTDTLKGGTGKDKLFGGSGGDRLLGGKHNDKLKGEGGNDRLRGDAGRDRLEGGRGNDTMDGGAGRDMVSGGKGNDVALFTASENRGAKDNYQGGAGKDTLVLHFTKAEWTANRKADMAAYEKFIDKHTGGSGIADKATYDFDTIRLKAGGFEKFKVFVNGKRVTDFGDGNGANNKTAPTITSGNAATVVENTAGTIFTATATGNDGAADDPITFGLTGTDAGLFNINAKSGAISFKAAPDFEAPGDTGGNNVYNFNVTANDGAFTSQKAVAVTVANINDTAPGFTSGATVDVAENTASTVYTAAADGNDGAADGPVTFSFGGGADDGLFNIDANTGAVTFKTAPDFETPGDTGGNNVYDVTITANDGVFDTDQDVAITVTNTNDTAPTFSSAATADFTEGGTGTAYTAVADGNDGAADAAITYSFGGGVDDGLFNIDANTGAVTFKTAPDFDTPADDGGNNVYDITVTANDGVFDTDIDVAITVDEMVWFIDNSVAGGPGSGTQADPFRSIAEFNAANGGAGGPEAGDTIYLRQGTGTYEEADGFNLLDNQVLIGQGQDLVVGATTIETGSAAQTPTIKVTGAGNNGIDLASGNTVRGLDIGDTTTTGSALDGTTVGTLTVSDVAISGTGQGIDIDGGTLSVSLDSLQSQNSGAHGIELDNVSGSFAVTGTTDIDGATTAAIDIAGSSTIDVDFSTIDVDGGGGGLIVNGGVGDFDLSSGIQVDNVSGKGIDISNSANDTFSFGDTDVGQTTSTGITSGIDLATGNAGATFTFSSLDVTTSNGIGLAAGASTLSIGGTTNTISATGGDGIDISGTTLSSGATFASVSSMNSGNEGIDLNNVTGSLTINGGTISGATGDSLQIDGGSSNVTFAGGITSTAANAVDISGRAGGTVTLSGTINHSSGSRPGIDVASNTGGTIAFSGANSVINTSAGAASGINLATNTGATISFTGGGLDIDAASGTGFNATGGGTVTVGGTGNTVTTTTGTGVNISSTTIGGAGPAYDTATGGFTGTFGVTFQSVTTNGATNGIVLSSAGSGGFAVTGDGVTGGDRNGTGGTINNSDQGVLVTSTSNVSLTHVDITTATGNSTAKGAVNLTSASNVSLADVEINDSNSHGIIATNSSNVGIVDTHIIDAGDGNEEHGIKFSQLTGTNLIDGSKLDGTGDHMEDGIELINTSGTGTLTVKNTTIEDNGTAAASTAFGENGITVRAQGSADLTLNVEDSTIQNMTGDAINAGSDGAAGGANLSLNLSGSTLQNVVRGVSLATANGNSADFNIVDGVTITGVVSTPIIIVGNQTGILRGTIGNTSGSTADDVTITGSEATGATGIGGIMTADSRSIEITADDDSTVIVDINNVTATQSYFGLRLLARNTADLDAALTNNSISIAPTGGFDLEEAINITANDSATIDVALSNNTGSGNVLLDTLRVRDNSTGTFRIEDYAGTAGNAAQIAAFINAQNPLIAVADIDVSQPNGPISGGTNIVVAPLVAAAGQGPGAATLTNDMLAPVVAAAVERWADAGLSDAQLSLLDGALIHVGDLGGDVLGATVGNHVVIDTDAAGWGWFVDETAGDDSEFTAAEDGSLTAADDEAAGIDLLTVVLHELGHVLGIDHDDHGLLSESLGGGTRLLPGDHTTLPAADDVSVDTGDGSIADHEDAELTPALDAVAEISVSTLDGDALLI